MFVLCLNVSPLGVQYKCLYKSTTGMITEVQCRMARAALSWGVRELAKAAGVSANTVARFEGGKPANPATLKVIRQAFEAAGIRFNEDGSVSPPEKGEAE